MKRLLFILLLLLAFNVHAQNSKPRIQTAFIYNFATNVTWPPEYSSNYFRITLLSPSDALLVSMKALASAKRINGQEIKITRINRLSELTQCEMLVVKETSIDVIQATMGKHILIISENSDSRYSMINMVFVDDKISYQTNIKLLESEQLTLSSSVIKNAVSDPANWKKLLQETEQQLEIERNRVATRDSVISAQDRQLGFQIKMYNTYKDSARQTVRALSRMQTQVNKGKDKILENQKLLEELSLKVLEKNRNLAQKENQLKENFGLMDKQQKAIDKQVKILSDQRLEIERTKRENDSKQEKLESSSALIAQQQYMILGFSLLAVIIGFLLYINLRSLRKTSKLKDDLALLNEGLEDKVASRTEDLSKSLKDKEVMLKEIHHRVKNNLSVVVGMIKMQRRANPNKDVKDVLLDTQSRIMTMSNIHEKLYKSDNLATVDLQEYFTSLVTSLLATYKEQTKISFVVKVDEGVDLQLSQIIPLGLMLNEFLTNSLKYAFQDQPRGTITIDMRARRDNVEMVYQDNGVGLPDDLDWQNAGSLGLSLINSFVRQLKGSIETMDLPGTNFKILFKKER